MADYIPKPDREAAAKMAAVLAALAAVPGDFGVVAADIAPLQSEVTAFVDALNESDASKAAANIAVKHKDDLRAAVEKPFRELVQRIQVSPTVTDAHRATAGIPIRDSVRTFSAPVQPIDLVATATPGGVNALKWKAGGNASGVQYVVEAKTGGVGDFVLVDVTNATTYKHVGRTPGQREEYRVRARRGSATSAPSNVAAVY
jgi:hypothetical protein